MLKIYLITYTLTGSKKIVIAESKIEAADIFMNFVNKYVFFFEHYIKITELTEKGIVEL